MLKSCPLNWVLFFLITIKVLAVCLQLALSFSVGHQITCSEPHRLCLIVQFHFIS